MLHFFGSAKASWGYVYVFGLDRPHYFKLSTEPIQTKDYKPHTLFFDLAKAVLKGEQIEIRPKGTPFQQKVWQATQHIPMGHVKTYKDIAHAIGQPGSARAVGQALKNNPFPLLIPCHRVIGSQSLGGFAFGSYLKKDLLAEEGFVFPQRADPTKYKEQKVSKDGYNATSFGL